MKQIKLFATLMFACVLLVSCASEPAGPTRAEKYKGMYDEQPKVLLIMPPINNTTQVSAKDLFFTTLHEPLADAGYYVLPPIITMTTLQRESGYDSERFLEGDLSLFRTYFGADAVVFTVINRWDKSMLSDSVDLGISYIVRSTLTGNILFQRDITYHFNFRPAQVNTGTWWINTLVNLSASAIASLSTDNVLVAMDCNTYALWDIPYGPYHPMYMKDQDLSVDTSDEYFVSK